MPNYKVTYVVWIYLCCMINPYCEFRLNLFLLTSYTPFKIDFSSYKNLQEWFFHLLHCFLYTLAWDWGMQFNLFDMLVSSHALLCFSETCVTLHLMHTIQTQQFFKLKLVIIQTNFRRHFASQSRSFHNSVPCLNCNPLAMYIVNYLSLFLKFWESIVTELVYKYCSYYYIVYAVEQYFLDMY